MKRAVNKLTAIILLGILFVFAFAIVDNIYSLDARRIERKPIVLIQTDPQTGEQKIIVVSEDEAASVGLFTTPSAYVNSINPNPLPDPPDTTGHH
jgi:hypothetical protein